MKVLPRRILLSLGGLLLGLVLIAVGLLVQGGGTGRASGIGGPFRLTDQNGRTVTDATYAGEPKLVFFGYTHCPDVCPTTLSDLSTMLGALGPDKKVAVLFVTVDPERDTPPVLKDYLTSFDPRITGLTGTPDEIGAILKAYRVYAKKIPTQGGDYTMDHTALVYLMGKDGNFVQSFNPELEHPKEAATTLSRYL